jgi:hypothetical protein
MTDDEIIRMAWKTGLVIDGNNSGNDDLFAFANLVAAHKAKNVTAEAYRCGVEAGTVAEREACAAICEEEEELRDHTPFDCTLRIRARGEQK